MTNLEAAIKYAEKGWPVFPCSVSKQPLMSKEMGGNGVLDATTDTEQITKWWTEHPYASIGMATGPGSGLWVLDIDQPNGPENLQNIERKYGVLPETLTQKTGGGGLQYFFTWNGHEIRNSSSKVSKNIDIRGNGGYVILPPSSHPSKNKYQWITKTPPTKAPDWITDIAVNANSKTANPTHTDNVSAYNQKALAGEITRLATATEGERNDTLNGAAHALGQLIAGNGMDRSVVESSLMGVAMGTGLTMREAQTTISSGIESGIKIPRATPKGDKYHFDFNVSKQSKQSKQPEAKEAKEAEVSRSKQGVSRSKQESNANNPFNLHYLIGQWIENSTGYFTTDQVDREFGLTTRAEKNNRSKSLYIYKQEDLIKRDKKAKGKWHVIDNKIDWIDLNTVEDTSFEIKLPFNLHEKISIPPKSIIVLAGTTNAGKTAFILNTLALNIKQDYQKIYLMSEMGGSEYKHRVFGTNCSMAEWNKEIKAAEKSYDFDGTIQNFNPNGLTCIDYLEEIDGEYFKIASSIRDIYDALVAGVALVAIQKKSAAEYGRGGEATSEKARLYMTIDFLCSLEHSIICALKITKAKHSLHENMIGKEIHFKIENGSHMTPLTDWTHSSKINRAQSISGYEREDGSPEPDYIPFKFMTEDGVEVQLRENDFKTWRFKFQNIDLCRELKQISDMSYPAPWMKRKSWFFQLGGQLEKKDKGTLF